jgi:hypothetical protein
MRVEEAIFIGRKIIELHEGQPGRVLNLGSSTAYVREVIQPHIQEHMLSPLMQTRIQAIHADLKHAEGVDLAGDIFDPAFQSRLAETTPTVVLACNLLEHLPNSARGQFPAIVDAILPPGAYLILSVPYSYPIHFDPIDTYYRPNPRELCALFPSFHVVEERVIVSTTHGAELISEGIARIVKTALRLLMPFYKFRGWLSYVHRFRWLFRPYKISCVVLRKPVR